MFTRASFRAAATSPSDTIGIPEETCRGSMKTPMPLRSRIETKACASSGSCRRAKVSRK